MWPRSIAKTVCRGLPPLLLASLWLTACTDEGVRQELPPPLDVPAGFEGVLPCVDCDGIRTSLLLRADRVFLLRQTWLGRETDDSLVDVGRWRWRDDREAALLDLAAGTRQFGVTADGRLRPLDRLGQPVAGEASATLEPADVEAVFRRPWRWRGMYRQAGGEGLFHDCGSGLTRPVVADGGFHQLARAYAAQRSVAGAWLLVTLEGWLEPLPVTDTGEQEGAAAREALRVTGVDRAWPGEDCGRREAGSAAVSGLEDTVWWLADISGAALPAARARAPRIRLLPGTERLEGFGGCNVILGGYMADATGLSFSDVSTTYKECPGTTALERRLVSVLRSVDAYAVDGGELWLYADGAVVARFDAGPPAAAASGDEVSDSP